MSDTRKVDRQKVVLTIIRTADETGAFYSVDVERKPQPTRDECDEQFDRALNDEDGKSFYANDFDTMMDLALQYGDLFKGKVFVG